MPNEIYHRSNWGNANAEGFGDVYYDHAATNKLYNHSDYYENSNGTDKILKDLSNKASIVLTPTAYSDGSLNTVIPPYQVLPTELVTNGDFSDGSTGWTSQSDVTFGDGTVSMDSTSQNAYINQFIITVGKKYRVSITVDALSITNKLELINGSGLVYKVLEVGTNNFDVIPTGNNAFRIRTKDGATSTISSVSVKEVQEADFDFSRGSSATRVNEQGLVEDVQGDDLPRIDYTDGEGSLLLEPQSTNLVTYSEDFSQWSNPYVTLESGYLAPDGSNNAYKVSGTVGTSSIYLGGVSGTDTRTIWARTVSGTGTANLCSYGQNTNNNFTITPQWQRFEVNGTTTSAGASNFYAVDFRFQEANALSELIIWGAQSEALSYATSYIPTNGSTVTRSADVANNSGNADLINSTEGVLYAEISGFKDDPSNRYLSIHDGTNQNAVYIAIGGNDFLYVGVRSNNTTQYDRFYSRASGFICENSNKIAVHYKQNDFFVYLNGNKILEETSGSTPIGMDELAFNYGGSSRFYGNVKSVAVFKEALTDEQLQELTS